jgi:hypothetical protein
VLGDRIFSKVFRFTIVVISTLCDEANQVRKNSAVL